MNTIFKFAELVSVAVSRVSLDMLSMDYVLHGGQEHTQVVRRIDQFADHADGLFARVEVDVDLSCFF